LRPLVHIVDDDPSFRKAVKRRLGFAGYSVRTYVTAEQFLDQQLAEIGPSCLLTDLKLPGLSGLELQDRLRAFGSPLSIVFVSGFADDGVRRKAIAAGAIDFLTKPINSDQLLRSINAAVAARTRCFSTPLWPHKAA
jgi:FixJ family two-component response regulator